jgi:hypothetical protein
MDWTNQDINSCLATNLLNPLRPWARGPRNKHSGDIVINITQKVDKLWIVVKHVENHVNMPNLQDNLKPSTLEG